MSMSGGNSVLVLQGTRCEWSQLLSCPRSQSAGDLGAGSADTAGTGKWLWPAVTGTRSKLSLSGRDARPRSAAAAVLEIIRAEKGA